MIKLLEKSEIDQVSNTYNINKEYLESLVGNMTEYMYVSTNDEIDGYMICFNDGNNIIIKDINANNFNVFSLLLKHLEFNANKDTIIETNDNTIIEILKTNGFNIVENNSDKIVLKRDYKQLTPSNISIIEYYDQDDKSKEELLNQINEPLWPGARYLYNKIKTNSLVNGKVYIIYDNDKNHIITFASLSDTDEIASVDLKPWIGCIYTFRPYRGNRFSEMIINYILNIAKENNIDNVYLSSNHKNLYEKYGFVLEGIMKTINNDETQVFRYDTRKLEQIKK